MIRTIKIKSMCAYEELERSLGNGKQPLARVNILPLIPVMLFTQFQKCVCICVCMCVDLTTMKIP